VTGRIPKPVSPHRDDACSRARNVPCSPSVRLRAGGAHVIVLGESLRLKYPAVFSERSAARHQKARTSNTVIKSRDTAAHQGHDSSALIDLATETPGDPGERRAA
jgi:hypothetical protein